MTAHSPIPLANKTVQQWASQLVTPEDRFHIHKTLGFLVLLSSLYRMLMLFTSVDMGFRDNPELTVPTLILHTALNLASFQFKLPQKRIKSGYRIWPEYRLHSLVFLLRSLIAILLNWLEQEFSAIRWPRYTFLLLVLGTMACADLTSLSVEESSGFAREMDAPVLTRYFFSVAQCGATAYVLTGDRRNSLQFVMVLIIQWNAFLMTLQRKNLASQTVLMAFYGTMLGLGIATARVSPGMRVVVHWAAVMRTGPRLPGLRILQNNKYLLWVVVYMGYIYGVQPYEGREWFPAIDVGTFLLVILVGYIKYRGTVTASGKPKCS